MAKKLKRIGVVTAPRTPKFKAAGQKAALSKQFNDIVGNAFVQRCVPACVSESGWVAQLLKVKGPHPSVVDVKSEERRMAPDFTF
jgi:hypothetical protein